MERNVDDWLDRLAGVARFVAVCGWMIAAIGVPVTLLVGADSALMLVLLITLSWQLVPALVLAVVSSFRREARPGVSFQITRWGRLYIAVTALFVALSLYWGLNLIYLAASFLLGGLLCSVLLPPITLSRTRTEWSPPEHIFAGTPFPVSVEVKNVSSLLSTYALQVNSGGDGPAGARRQIARLRPGQQRSLLLTRNVPRRGEQRLGGVGFRTAFPFGVLKASTVSRQEREVLVYPRLGQIRHDVLHEQKGGEAEWARRLRRRDTQGEFHSLREYQHGDNPRHIHWPTSARLHQLYVREFEKLEMQRVLILLDAYAPDEGAEERRSREDRFERAISFAATLASELAAGQIFFAFGACCPHLVNLPYDTGPRHFYNVLEQLARAEMSEEHTMGKLLARLDDHLVSNGELCMVTAGPGALPAGSLRRSTVCIDASEPRFHEYFSI